jgi:2-dehydro-3-deoxyphosphogluconate aldolase / (4S)-4-hydroxy-2-oxoglutarate aldolase
MKPRLLIRHGRVAEEIRRQRLIVILRRVEPRDRLLDLVEELVDAGARIFEITFDAPSAADDVAAVREQLADRDLLVGAGTVLDAETAALAEHADFLVSPALDLELVEHYVDQGTPFIPGTFTPNEMRAAWEAGATFVKLFPASAARPQMIREMRGPLPEIEIIATGGVDGSNAEAYLKAGAVAVGIGSALVRASADERRELVARLAQP